ncbi:unnamed protein product [Lathyrus sativus]|nr:unnamed protein product [Lathyrus sativus]
MNVKGIMMKENKSDSTTSSSSSIGTFSEDSMGSMCCCSSELIEDADSSSNGSLCDLSELMNNLPIKRGLSMFYEGKTQSFSCLGEVQKMEDVPKKSMGYKKRMKKCKSYGDRIWYSPKATISKKTSRVPFSSLLTKRESYFLIP